MNDSFDRRTSRLALALLILNIAMVTLGVFGIAWQARRARAASKVLAPTHLALLQAQGVPTSTVR